MAVEGVHKAKEAASALTDDTDSRHVIHFRFFPPYSRLRASMHRMHTTSDRDNATFAPLNLFPLASCKEGSPGNGQGQTDRAHTTFAATTINIQRVFLSLRKQKEYRAEKISLSWLRE